MRMTLQKLLFLSPIYIDLLSVCRRTSWFIINTIYVFKSYNVHRINESMQWFAKINWLNMIAQLSENKQAKQMSQFCSEPTLMVSTMVCTVAIFYVLTDFSVLFSVFEICHICISFITISTFYFLTKQKIMFHMYSRFVWIISCRPNNAMSCISTRLSMNIRVFKVL